MKPSLSKFAQNLSEKLNQNFFFLLTYYCITTTLIIFILSRMNDTPNSWSSDRLIESLGLGVSLTILHRFVLQRKGLSLGKRLSIGLVLMISLGIAFSLLIRLF